MIRLTLASCLTLLVVACQAPRAILSPETIRAAELPEADKKAALDRWRRAIEIGNEFLKSPANQTLPRSARLHLEPAGMSLRSGANATSIPLVLIDDYMKSSCVCATVDTRRDEVLVFRPWGTDPSLPILTHNTFFDSPVAPFKDPAASLAWHILRFATIFHHHAASHISGWEWFKCQHLEWLIGSGHHRESMRLADATAMQFGRYWHRR